MTTRGRILLADDEATFLSSTAELLRREGYECETVPDAPSALARATEAEFDLLISDLEMPGNEDLALIRGIGDRIGGLPVIIVTGYPSVRTAVASVELPVTAYLVKPVEFQEILTRVDTAVSRFRAYTAMSRAESRLREWGEEFASIREGGENHAGPPIDAFLALTLRNVMGSLTDLGQLSRALAGSAGGPYACQLVNCPRGLQLRTAVEETIQVLESTKTAFRSKTLANLRHRLEMLLQTN